MARDEVWPFEFPRRLGGAPALSRSPNPAALFGPLATPCHLCQRCAPCLAGSFQAIPFRNGRRQPARRPAIVPDKSRLFGAVLAMRRNRRPADEGGLLGDPMAAPRIRLIGGV